MLVAFALSLLMALPDALLALWFKLLGEGVLQRDTGRRAHRGRWRSASPPRRRGSSRTVSTRVQRRFRDKVTIALEAHVARLQASVATIAHQERPDYLDRLAMLRDQVFVLDHMYMSVFSTCGWIVRLAVTIALLMSIHPALVLLALFAVPTAITSMWRPGVERVAQQRAAPFNRLARHLFTTATTAPPGKEVRVTGIGDRLVRAAARGVGRAGFGPVSAVRWRSAGVAHAGVGDLRRARTSAPSCSSSLGLRASAGNVLLVLAAGSRLSAYIGATVGELGFLTGFWAYGARRLAWLEDYAASLVASADLPVPARLDQRHPLRARLVRVSRNRAARPRRREPGTARRAPWSPSSGENGAGKTTLVKLLAKLYEPTSAADPRRRRRSRPHARRRVARAAGGCVPGLLPLRVQGAAHRRRRRRAAPGRRAGRRHGGRPGRRGRRGGAARRRARDAARPDVAGGRRGVVRPVAEARARARLHARPSAAAGARRADGRARRRDRARAVRTLRRRGARRRGSARRRAEPTAASPSWSRTASAPSAWPTSSSCSTARTSSRSVRTRI